MRRPNIGKISRSIITKMRRPVAIKVPAPLRCHHNLSSRSSPDFSRHCSTASSFARFLAMVARTGRSVLSGVRWPIVTLEGQSAPSTQQQAPLEGAKQEQEWHRFQYRIPFACFQRVPNHTAFSFDQHATF
jgi:hypothetical protein